jgi:hypothetical protein
MPLASGVAKQLVYKKEVTWGTAPGASGAQRLRRDSSDLNLVKDTYSSTEIRSDYQVADFRHGVRRAEGSVKGSLSCTTWGDFLAAALRKAWASVTAISSLSITVAGSGPYTLTRSAGSWLTDGIKVGDVVRLTAGGFNAANINKNLVAVGVTATVLTVITLNGSTMTAEGPIASATLSVPGKKNFVPQTGHTDDSFWLEHWFSDIAQSEQFSGCKVGGIDIDLPASGMAKIDVRFLGKDLVTGTSAYFTSPTAETTTGELAAVNGVVVAGGTQLAIVTAAKIAIDAGMSPTQVVGSNSQAAIFPGRVRVSGEISVYFETATYRDAFVNESELSLVMTLSESSAAAANFMSFVLPRIKVGGAAKSDGEQGIVQTHPFTALFNGAGGAGTSSERSTIVVQDATL